MTEYSNEYFLDMYLSAQADAEEKCPKCSTCKDPIWQETAYEIGNKLACEDCLKDMFVGSDRCVRCGAFSDDIYDIEGELLCFDCIEDEFKIFV